MIIIYFIDLDRYSGRLSNANLFHPMDYAKFLPPFQS